MPSCLVLFRQQSSAQRYSDYYYVMTRKSINLSEVKRKLCFVLHQLCVYQLLAVFVYLPFCTRWLVYSWLLRTDYLFSTICRDMLHFRTREEMDKWEVGVRLLFRSSQLNFPFFPLCHTLS